MREALLLFLVVVSGTGGEICVTRAMKHVGEVTDFRPLAVIRVILRANSYEPSAAEKVRPSTSVSCM